ncbi:putative phosphoglycerate mutase [Staphylococcus piscifermentans]|uniref:phosphoglycerate mutase (2,3-diphosphoglycerate-dependent) n=1 Tax=Staphylococcus piscifermentans TaxID=70258 RepID=A0A239UIQ8_9STAP|nr:histidine phosphatase family protein [Staphylococcus piscifermentans]RTX82897.1 histidine phosphatase family protein [Staphylococcus piscifermentans]GEP85154.1 phosphoglycerate mutase [Staphylococcus piscifermentans]SNV09917.1 putative phosphoglycerate mutase [Staphylococcus piscifermentans]
MEIYLIRHGESTANYDNRNGKHYFCGQLDVDLTEAGIQSAESLKAYFSDIHIDHIYVSDLKRTVQTYENGFDETIPVTITALLRERSLGKFEGHSKDALIKQSEYRPYFEDPLMSNFRHSFTQRAPGGDNYNDVLARVDEFFSELFDKKDSVVVIVAHLIWIRCCLFYLGIITEEELFNKKIKNTTPILVNTDHIVY